MKRVLMAVLVCGGLFTGCAHRMTNELLDGILWVQTSGEYEAVTTQVFRTAAARLEEALADPAWSALAEETPGPVVGLPPAIIVDLDETILDNSPFEARLVADNIDYSSDLWEEWVEKGSAQAIPGAQEFLDFAQSKGVEVFYVTNRDAKSEEATRRNLRLLGLPASQDRDTVLMNGEKGWGSDKSSRRLTVAEDFRVLLLLGDDLNDFVSGAQADEPESRRQLARKYSDRWGRQWHVLPNPLYGSWEASLYGRDFGLPDKEKLRRKYLHLRPFEVN